jgi:RNA polymerase sigma-70 factor, ECF subfamily
MDTGHAPLRVVASKGRLVSDAPEAAHNERVGPISVEDAFRTYSRYVATIAFRLLGRDDEVDDVVQEVFLQAHKGLQQLRDDEAIKPWLATVTVRVARRRLRLRRMGAWLGWSEPTEFDRIASPGASPEHQALLARVYAVLETLPVNQRIAWALRHVEGEKLEEVAQIAGCSLATAKRWIGAAQAAIEGAFGHE